MIRYFFTLGCLVVIILCSSSCRPEGEVVRSDKDSFSSSDQAKIGNEFENHIVAHPIQYALYRPENNQGIYKYLNKLLSTIVNTMTVENRSNFNWKIFVMRDEENMTAFTLPGGKIFISDGFLKFMTSEAQLIALMSHEMCYADRGIAMELLEKNFSGLILGDIIFNNPVAEIDQMISTLREIPLSMDQVKTADLYSIEILCPFQYASDGIATILDSVTDNDYPLEWLDIRPKYENRSIIIKSSARECGEETIIAEETTEEELRYQQFVLNNLD